MTSLQGILTVAEQEFTIRIRAGRWRWLLGAWFAVLALVTVLIRLAVQTVDEGHAQDKGVIVYGGLTLLVLGLALLVVPTLSAQSVNGDRERGTLATLQVTRLTATDIALGKFAAAWGTSLVFLALTLPLVLYAMTQGGVPFSRVVVVTLVVALVLGAVIAVSLCLSALLHRTTTSGVLAYLVVFALTLGTTVTFGLALALSSESYTQTVPGFCQTPGGGVQPTCPDETFQSRRSRPDRVWWLLAPNPFVIVADAAPKLPKETAAERARREALEARGVHASNLRDSDPLGGLGGAVRDAHKGPNESDGSPVWPWGLGFDVLVGAGALWLTARRLTTPTRTLPVGQRVA
jgi:ABC-type transport system involved in multi-copper enzyme maturation permease subunit